MHRLCSSMVVIDPKKRLFPGGGRSTSFVFMVKVWRVGTSFLLLGQAEYFSSWLPLLLPFLGYHLLPRAQKRATGHKGDDATFG